MPLFDSAIFDSAIFDTGADVPVAQGKSYNIWNAYRRKRDAEEARKDEVPDTRIEAIPAPVMDHAAVYTPVVREVDYAVVTDAPRRNAQLAELQARREAHEIQQQEMARIRAELEDEEAAKALLAWLLS